MAILQGARITGSIIATTFIKASGFSGSLTASNLYVLGKAGIGTTSPIAPLDVQSNTGATGIIIRGRADNSTALRFYANNATTQQLYIGTDDSNIDFVSVSTRPIRFFVNALLQHQISQLGVFSWKDGAGGDRMTLNSTGLGIGTSSPRVLLDLAKANNVGQVILIGETSTNVRTGFGLDSATAGMRIFCPNLNSEAIYIGGISTSDGTTFTRNHSFGVAGKNSWLNEQGGNVGIGTTSPLKTLQINAATASIRLEESSAGSKRLELRGRQPDIGNSKILAPKESSMYSVLCLDQFFKYPIGLLKRL